LFYDSHATKACIDYRGADPRGEGAHAQYAILLDALLRADEGSNLAGRTQAERQSLDTFAHKEGWLIEDAGTFQGLSDRLGGGNEHDVFLDAHSLRVIKRTITEAGYGAQGTARAYLENLRRQNLMFDAGYILEGLVQEDHKLQFLVSQPFIEGVEASDADIEAFFMDRGFAWCAQDTFSVMMGSRLWTVADARPANIYINSQGVLFPIDVQILAEDVVHP
jgi:hypothetical protein